jgi:phage tail sheath protein FI
MEASLRGVKSFEFVVGNADQDALNPANINVLRKMNGTPVSWGARVFTNDPEWKYIPVRRTALHIGDSIKQGIQWAVFEPNNNNLWSSLRINIESFLDNMFRSGAFQGQTASQAYFVKCGIGSTMTQAEVDAGMVIVQVGFAALKPAEFVIVNVQQKVEQ